MTSFESWPSSASEARKHALPAGARGAREADVMMALPCDTWSIASCRSSLSVANDGPLHPLRPLIGCCQIRGFPPSGQARVLGCQALWLCGRCVGEGLLRLRDSMPPGSFAPSTSYASTRLPPRSGMAILDRGGRNEVLIAGALVTEVLAGMAGILSRRHMRGSGAPRDQHLSGSSPVFPSRR